MSATFKNSMRDLMNLAWSFVKKNGLTMSEAMKKAWMNLKLKSQMKKRIVKFYFQKVDGSIRHTELSKRTSCHPPREPLGKMIPVKLTLTRRSKHTDAIKRQIL